MVNDNIRSIINCVSQENVTGYLVALDMKKAFDSVRHSFIVDRLKTLGLGTFVPLIKVLYNKQNTDILINGAIVNGYDILNGAKQGDALSCIIYIICIDDLIQKIEQNDQIPNIRAHVPKSSTYADDLWVVTTGKGITEVFKMYEEFEQWSGLDLHP